MTISNEYRDLNAQMHREMPYYGANGHRWGGHVLTLIKRFKAESVLDWGAGKGTLKEYLRRYTPAKVQNYDPAVPEFSAPPEPADLVICTDVLEHVERPFTRDVLRGIADNARKAAFFNISLCPAKKSLPDGRNAHINLRDPIEWFKLVDDYMAVVCYELDIGRAVSMVVVPKEASDA